MGEHEQRSANMGVTFNTWLEKFQERVVESKWTKLFVLASTLQLCSVIVLESRVLDRNNRFRKTLMDSGNTTCTKPSIDRMLLIEQENAIFMVFQLFQLWFCLNAVYNQNTFQIITIAVINFLCGLCSIVQILEIRKWSSDLNAACGAVVPNFDKDFGSYDVPLVVCLVIFSLIIAFLSWKLYQQFGWNIYKRIGADIRMQKIYKTILIFVLYLKLDLFFILVTAVEVFMSFNIDTPQTNNFIFVLPKGLYYFHMFVTIMILLLEVLAYYALRREWKIGMIVYLVLSLCTVVDFIVLLKFATKTITQSWYFFILLVVVAIVLSLLTWVWALLVTRDFDKGFANLIEEGIKKKETRKPIIIED
ncbi:18725_t:CDS:10 [Acaulospora morrowiae]|uniref:18725_t:CDS:1 n=1 Tax=Acaulospora morrowiae TaxID=94023 RepID=A0A9N9BIN6_9GLOM|nr:18725_t:CDS:10 [Acaulospora morrowiae]